MSTTLPVAIVGGGITGLTAAFQLQQRGISVALYEASDRLGGVIRTIRQDGFVTECGPNAILETSPKIGQLVQDLRLTGRQLYSGPSAAKRYLVRDGRVIPLPSSPAKFAATPLFSTKAKLRLFAEPFIRRAPAGREESVAEFVRRRLGDEFLDYAINPFVAGVYAGDPATLSLTHAFPKLHALEQRYGSLLLGQLLGARERRQRKEVSKQDARKFSFDSGLQLLIDSLKVSLRRKICLNRPVQRLSGTAGRWELSDNERRPVHQAHSAVLLAAPAHALAKFEIIDHGIPICISKLAQIQYPPVATVSLGYRREDVAHPMDGFGMLIPEIEGRNSLGTIFSSSLFPHRAPDGHVLLTSYIGGARAPELALAAPHRIVELVQEDLRDLLGVRGDPVFQYSSTFRHAIPQYELGYGSFKQMFDKLESDSPGLFWAGNYRDGISLGDSIVSGCRAAERIIDFLQSAPNPRESDYRRDRSPALACS